MSGSEVWLPVPGYAGYLASDLGNIRSPRGTVLKPWKSNSAGHLKVRLSGRRSEWVHRIIALTFHGPCPAGHEVRHLDGAPGNNSAANLQYGTHAENMADLWAHGTKPQLSVTHCPKGHAYTEIAAPGQRRYCRPCVLATKRRYYRRQIRSARTDNAEMAS